MPHTGVWKSAVVLAAVTCLSGCGIASTAATSATTYHARATSSTPAAREPGTTAATRATPGAALVSWIHQIAAGDRSGACNDMAAQTSEMTECMSAAGTTTFTSLHGNFVTDGIRSSTPIDVTGADVKGTSATIGGDDVRVSGTTLNTLVAEHSTGVKPGQLNFSFDLSRAEGAWYVTNFNMDVG